MPAGLAPKSADELNLNVGMVLRQFAATRMVVHQDQLWLAAEDLTQPPYAMSAADQTLIKSAVSQLDTALQAIDMTFISRLIGLPT